MREIQIVDAGELAAAYAKADYAVRLDGDTFRLKVGSPAGDMEAYWPATRYAFITAWNPPPGDAPRAVNDAAQERLHARLWLDEGLDGRGVGFVLELGGVQPDG